MLYQSFGQNFILGDWQKTISFLLKKIKIKSGFICLPCSLNDLSQQEEIRYKKAYSAIDYCTPDGMPLVFYFRYCKKIKSVERIYGPDLMNKLLYKTQDNRHYFCGSTIQTLEKLKNKLNKKYPYLKSLKFYSPPFADPSKYQKKLVKNLLNNSVEILWIGLSSPKQVLLASYLKEKVPNIKIFCVGAAFDFFSGSKKQAPVVFRKIGLEWLYRLVEEPKRLSKRYIFEIPYFLLKKTLKKNL